MIKMSRGSFLVYTIIIGFCGFMLYWALFSKGGLLYTDPIPEKVTVNIDTYIDTTRHFSEIQWQ